MRTYADLVLTTAVLLYNDQKKTILTCIIETFQESTDCGVYVHTGEILDHRFVVKANSELY